MWARSLIKNSNMQILHKMSYAKKTGKGSSGKIARGKRRNPAANKIWAETFLIYTTALGNIINTGINIYSLWQGGKPGTNKEKNSSYEAGVNIKNDSEKLKK